MLSNIIKGERTNFLRKHGKYFPSLLLGLLAAQGANRKTGLIIESIRVILVYHITEKTIMLNKVIEADDKFNLKQT